MNTIQEHRDFYARLVVGTGGSSNKRLIAAFASVERERFVGTGPWNVLAGDKYLRTVSDDPRLLYQDILVSLVTDKGINNGQPSLHARCMSLCAPKDDESVLHIGAGSGYYTEILCKMVGSKGTVTAIEIDPDLAERARQNLVAVPNATVIVGDASRCALPQVDVIYVNAGVTHLMPAWLDALNVGGRLVVPMTPNLGAGFMLMVKRLDADRYSADALCAAAFIPCSGVRDRTASRLLSDAIQAKPPRAIRSLRRNGQPDETAWCAGDGWWLSTEYLST